MKSSEQVSLDGGFLSNGPGYSLLAVYMPLTVISTLVFLLRAFLPVPLPPLPIIISALISAVAASLYCDFFKDTKSGRTTADIRGGFIIVGIICILSSLFRWELPWRKRFLPDFITVLASLVALYAWVTVISLKLLFSACKRLESYIALYQGEHLHAALFNEVSLLQYTGEGITVTRRNYLLQLIFIGIITLICAILSIHLPPAMYFLLIIVLAGGIGIIGFFGIVRWEYRCAAEGMSLAAFERTRRMLGILTFLAFAIVLAILCASEKSLLPFSAITGFFSGLFGMFRNLFSPIIKTKEAESFEPAPTESIYPAFLDQMEKGEPSPFWEWFKYGIIILAGAVFIRFMISPLLNRAKIPSEKLTFRQRLRRIITEWFTGVLSALASFIVFIRHGKNRQKIRRPSAEEIQSAAGAVLKAYSLEKKHDMKRSVTLFTKLIIWGAEVRHVIWKPVYAPGEYCSLLAASPLPAADDADGGYIPRRQNEGIIRCGELFEQAIYSAEVLSRAEQKEFKDLVEEIIREFPVIHSGV